MIDKRFLKLNPKKRYLQIALNNTLNEARNIINQLPVSDRIILEAGTPLIKRYGIEGIKKIRTWYEQHLLGMSLVEEYNSSFPFPIFGLVSGPSIFKKTYRGKQKNKISDSEGLHPYVVADLKMMDRGATEVEIVKEAGVSAAVALGAAPVESLDTFIQKCEELEIDAMVDMMNVESPLNVLRKLKKVPAVVILHRGVDEERFNKEKQIPLHEIRRIKGSYDIMISIAGGDTIRETQRAIFNDADIVVVWKSFFQNTKDTASLAEQFLKEIR